MLRFLAVCCLVLSVIAAPQIPLESDTPLERATGGIQKFNAGKREAGDKLIWNGSGNKMNDFDSQIIIEIPFPWFGMKNKATITQIVATAMLDSGDAQFSIVSGGIGHKDVNLKIVSTDAHKVNYKFQIYGK